MQRVVEDASGVWSALTPSQQRLLQVPQQLYLWSTIANDPPARTSFRTATDLMRAFWQHVRSRLAEMGVPHADLEVALGSLVTRLDEDGSLTAPITALDKWPKVRHALGTLHVLDMQETRIRFAHQSYFDYYLAELWLERLRKKGASITDWVTAMGEQSLLRRGQLRQLLAVLRDDDLKRFVDAVRDLLVHPTVRFHLQHLALQFVGHISDPKAAELTCILDLLNQGILRDAICSQTLNGRAAWFDALDTQGIWEEWLPSEESWKSHITLCVLRSIGEPRGDRVAQLLTPYADGPDPWPQRVRNMIPWRADRAGQLHQTAAGLFGRTIDFVKGTPNDTPDLEHRPRR